MNSKLARAKTFRDPTGRPLVYDESSHTFIHESSGTVYILNEDQEMIRLDKHGCEARSEDEDSESESVKDFVVSDSESEAPDTQESEMSEGDLEVEVAESEEKVRIPDIDEKNIVCGKRQRRAPVRYEETEAFKKHYLAVLAKEEQRAAKKQKQPMIDLTLAAAETRESDSDSDSESGRAEQDEEETSEFVPSSDEDEDDNVQEAPKNLD